MPLSAEREREISTRYNDQERPWPGRGGVMVTGPQKALLRRAGGNVLSGQAILPQMAASASAAGQTPLRATLARPYRRTDRLPTQMHRQSTDHIPGTEWRAPSEPGRSHQQ